MECLPEDQAYKMYYSVTSDKQDVDMEAIKGRVYAKDRMLHFEGISGEVCVHTVAGTLVYQGEALPVSLPQPGVYIVRHGQQTEKVVVM